MTAALVLFASLLLTNAAQVASAVANPQRGLRFALQGTVTFPCKGKASHFAIEDASGAATMITSRKFACGPFGRGTRISAVGGVEFISAGHGVARCDSVDVLGQANPTDPIDVRPSEIKTGKVDNRIVRLRGIVREVFRDEIDPPFVFLTVCSGSETVYAAFPDLETDISEFKKLTDADITVTGLCSTSDTGTRRQIGRIIDCLGPASFEVHRMPPSDPFAVPALGQMRQTDPSVVMSMTRRRVAGTVIAIWRENHLLVRDDTGLLHNIELAGLKLPAFGERVEAVGIPETDLYRINLTSAIWRPLAAPLSQPAAAQAIEAKDILSDRHGNPKILSVAHGKAFSMRGTVIDKPRADSLTLKSGGFTISVDASACPSVFEDISVDCKVRIAGTRRRISRGVLPITRMENATFSYTVMVLISRKS